MKYYLYVSEQKVNMLFAQIPTNSAKKITAEIGVNTGVLKAAYKSERTKDPQLTYYDKLGAVIVLISDLSQGMFSSKSGDYFRIIPGNRSLT